MNSGNFSVNAASNRRNRKSKTQRRGRPRSGAAAHAGPERELAAAGTLTRTKALLLAALRVWELKHRISD